MQESSIQETPTAAQLAQESRTLRPRGGDASRVTPGAQLNVESTSENLQVSANSLVATPSEPEDPSDQVPVALRTLANFLRSQNGVKSRSGIEHEKRVDYFKGIVPLSR